MSEMRLKASFLLSVVLFSLSTQAELKYSWDYVEFNGEVTGQDSSISGIAYDTKTRFLCAGFPALKPGCEIAIGCFDTDKYGTGSSPTFEPFAYSLLDPRSIYLKKNTSRITDPENNRTEEELQVVRKYLNSEEQGTLRHFKRKRPTQEVEVQEEVVWVQRPVRRRPHRPYKFVEVKTTPAPTSAPTTASSSSSSSSSSTTSSSTTTTTTTTTTPRTIVSPPRKFGHHHNKWRSFVQGSEENEEDDEIYEYSGRSEGSFEELETNFARDFSRPLTIKRPRDFISIHHPYFDDCGRLWFIDTGALELSPGAVIFEKPTLWAFKVRRGRYDILESKLFLKNELEDTTFNGLRSLVVDIHESCQDYHVYIPNHVDNQIVVYSGVDDRQWIFDHPVLEPVRSDAQPNIEIGGVNALALGQQDRNGYRPVFINVQTGRGQYVVNSRTLRTKPTYPYTFNFYDFVSVGYKDAGLNTAMDYDYSTKSLFYAALNSVDLNRWSTKEILNPDTFSPVYTDRFGLTGRDVQVDRDGNIWYLTGSGSNYKIHKFRARDLVAWKSSNRLQTLLHTTTY